MKNIEFDLKNFDIYREGNRLEVKKANEGLPNSLWDTYSSFANCDGGIIILGVKERKDGSWYTTHFQNKDKLLKDFWNTINNRKKVNVNLLNEEHIKTYEKNGDIIIAITVPKADREYKPVYINDDIFGGTFRRNHEGDYHCSESEVRGMLRDQAEKSVDNRVITNMDMSVLYPETIKSFRSRHKVVNENHVWHRLNDEEYLERIGAAQISDVDGKLHPTVAGLLMFGEEYKIRYEFPEYFLDYREMLDRTILKLSFIDKASSSDLSPQNMKGGEKGGEKGGKKGGEKHLITEEATKMQVRKNNILALLHENHSISARVIAQRLNITRAQAEKTIKSLKEEEKITREGSARSGSWIINE